jgi:ubiquinone/menaquinone biosynthesis C-methylase UbiE
MSSQASQVAAAAVAAADARAPADAGAGAAPAAPCCCYSRPRGGLYDQYFSWLMGRMSAHDGKLAPLKRRLFERLVAELDEQQQQQQQQQQQTQQQTQRPPLSILEVGAGRGPNFQLLADACAARGLPRPRLTCIEPNTAMHQACRQAARAAGFVGADGEEEAAAFLRPMYCEQLAPELFSASPASPPFDAALVTLVFCSVPDVQAALQALRRVVRPGGRLLLLEHVAADAQSSPGTARLQRLLDPVWHWIGDGCSLTRDTRAALREAGVLALADNERRLEAVAAGGGGGGGMGGLLPLVAGVLEM